MVVSAASKESLGRYLSWEETSQPRAQKSKVEIDRWKRYDSSKLAALTDYYDFYDSKTLHY